MAKSNKDGLDKKFIDAKMHGMEKKNMLRFSCMYLVLYIPCKLFLGLWIGDKLMNVYSFVFVQLIGGQQTFDLASYRTLVVS